jgi:hypothetical protein
MLTTDTRIDSFKDVDVKNPQSLHLRLVLRQARRHLAKTTGGVVEAGAASVVAFAADQNVSFTPTIDAAQAERFQTSHTRYVLPVDCTKLVDWQAASE